MSQEPTPPAAPEPVPTLKQNLTHLGPTDTRPQQADPTGTSIFPTALTAAYQPLELVGTGAEGAVWRTRARRTGAELAVKVHWDNQPMDTDLLAHLDNSAFHRHVPLIAESGRITTTSGTRDWVAMEYLPTTLADVITDLPPEADREAIIAELAALITFWQQQIDRNPLDFKPANILIRPKGPWPGQFVIADFGGIHRFTASQAHGDLNRFNLAYAPPEHTWSEHASPWPWWGLGEIAYELATGQARFRRPDGRVKADPEIVRGQILGEHGQAIPEQRWRSLVRGLLTVDPDDRWSSPQVNAWLAGHTPAITPSRTSPQVTFGRLNLTEGDQIAAHLLQAGSDAARWLVEEGGADQLGEFLSHIDGHSFDTNLLTRLSSHPDRADAAITAFGAAFAPHLRPTYAGHDVDVEGLVELAATDPAALRTLLADTEALRAISTYHCDHPECQDLARCDRIQRLAAEAPTLITHAQTSTEQLGQRLQRDPDSWPPLTQAELEYAHALATWAILAPTRLSAQLEANRASALLGPHWWRRAVLGADTSDSSQGRASMVATLVLAMRAATERATQQPRPHGAAYARSLWHRLITAVLATLALLSAVWAGSGAFEEVGTLLGGAFPAAVAGAALLALWPWRSPESAPRLLTGACWASALVFAAAYRGWGVDPPTSANSFWEAPEALVALLELGPAPFRVTWWWFQLLVASTVIVLAIKVVRFRMRLAYRQRYVHFWAAPRSGPTPEQRLGLAPLLALTWLGLAATAAVAAALTQGAPLRLGLIAPPIVYVVVLLAAGAAVVLASRTRLLWAAVAATVVASAGWVPALRLVEIPVGAVEACLLALAGLGGGLGAGLYARTRTSPEQPTP